jgi:hypothetical protein
MWFNGMVIRLILVLSSIFFSPRRVFIMHFLNTLNPSHLANHSNPL